MFELWLKPKADDSLPPGQYKEFRLYILTVNGASYAQLAELELYDATNTNRLRMAGVTANQSSYYSSGGTYDAYLAIDGNGQSKWTSSAGQQNNSWVSFVLPVAITPTSYVLVNVGSPSNEGVRMPNTFRLEAKNQQGEWVTLDSRSAQASWGAAERRTYTITLP